MIWETTYQLYSSIIPTQGYSRTVFHDLQKNTFVLCPNIYSDSIKNGRFSFSENSHLNEEQISEFVYFLTEENDFAFQTTIPLQFMPMSFEWDSFSIINNMIVEIDKNSNIESLNYYNDILKVEALGVIIKDFCPDKILQLKGDFIRSISVIIQFEISLNELNELISNCFNISNIKIINNLSKDYYNTILANKKTTFTHEKGFKKNQFCPPNIKLFTESQSHHTYFNRKLYINLNGDINNFPDDDNNCGNINDLSKPEDIIEIISSANFQRYWNIHKDKIDICKDCEFRHMCVDSRIPFKRDDNHWYHKEECEYNPYISIWKDDDGYLSLNECGIITNENGFTIDNKKIAKINDVLWGEEEEVV